MGWRKARKEASLTDNEFSHHNMSTHRRHCFCDIGRRGFSVKGCNKGSINLAEGPFEVVRYHQELVEHVAKEEAKKTSDECPRENHSSF